MRGQLAGLFDGVHISTFRTKSPLVVAARLRYGRSAQNRTPACEDDTKMHDGNISTKTGPTLGLQWEQTRRRRTLHIIESTP